MKLTGRDFAFRRMDGKHNLMMINCLLTVDGDLSRDALLEVFEARLVDYPRFTQCLRIERGGPRWARDERFEMAAHLHLEEAAETMSSAALSERISELIRIELDPARPLWNLTLFRNVEGGSALLLRIHHCLTDGFGLVHMLNHLTDRAADHADGPDPAHHPLLARPVFEPVPALGRRLSTGLRVALDIARIPLLLPDHRTRLKRRLSGEKKAVVSSQMDVARLKAIARRNRVTLNDVWIASVTGALRRYLIEHGEAMDRRGLRAAVTYNFRRRENAFRLGNEFTLVAVDLPTTAATPAERVSRTSAEMSAMKRSYRALATLHFLSILGRCPAWVQRVAMWIFSAKTSVVMTNLEGPSEPRFLAGRPIRDFLCWVPQTGRLGLGCSLMSYAGRVSIGVVSDANLVDDPDRLLQLVMESIGELEATGAA